MQATRSRYKQLLILSAISAGAVALTGCFGFLKPAESAARHFVLTPLPVLEAGAKSVLPGGVGVGQVRIPSYLFETSMALRKGTNEVEYLRDIMWAERLENGVQRVLAANLAVLMPGKSIRQSTWNSTDVDAELYVTVDRFDTDSSGRCVFIARWRIVSPGGRKALHAGETSLARLGPSPHTDPAGAVAVMSELLADFSREVVGALQNLPTLTAPVSR